MAYKTAHRNKAGKLTAFYIRVYRGLDAAGKQLKPFYTKFDVDPSWTERKAYKEADKFALIFEKECKARASPSADDDELFIAFAKKCIARKFASEEIKLSTYERYEDMVSDLVPYLGEKKLTEITARVLDDLYAEIRHDGRIDVKARARPKFTALFTRSANSKVSFPANLNYILTDGALSKPKLAKAAGIAESTVRRAVDGHTINVDKATAMAEVLKQDINTLFEVTETTTPLSGKTIREYHNLISTILAEAYRYQLIPQNPATLVKAPKYFTKESDFYSPEQIRLILQCILEEPIEWRALLLVLVCSGARRGEVLGLFRSDIDFDNYVINIRRNLLRSKEGLHIDTPKTARSTRRISLPVAVMEELKAYLDWRARIGLAPTGEWVNDDLLFLNGQGQPYHPDSVSQRVKKFSKRYPELADLKLHPHAFRHSIATMLLDSGETPVNVASFLGHSTPTTTLRIYAHVLEGSKHRMSTTVESEYGISEDSEGSVEKS